MDHDGGLPEYAPARIVATWPKGSFAENLAVAEDGMIFVTLHTDRAIVRVDPTTGAVTPFANFLTPVAGLAFASDGALIVSGGTPGQRGGVIWRVAADGSIGTLADLPDSLFLNGVTPLGDGRFLVADSMAGVIHVVDPQTGAVANWLADRRLAPTDASGTPGANGVKLFGGHAYVSVTATDTIHRVPVLDGTAGAIELVAARLRADDFAIDTAGTLFIATHPAHSLVRLATDGGRTTLAAAAQGMVGATAVAFGRTAADRTSVYVTTTGGTMTVPAEQQDVAKLVCVEVGVAGHRLGEPA